MMPTKHVLSLAACLLFIGLVLLAEQWTDFDIRLQNLFYDFHAGQWLITRAMHQDWGWILYGGYKKTLACLGVVCAVGWLSGSIIRYSTFFRQATLKITFALITIPLLVSTLKMATHVYGPRELQLYGGMVPYVRICEAYPASYSGPRDGRFFPAGHASGGFALMVLAFCFHTPRARRMGLLCGLFLGWLGGLYQMIRGEHFLSHTLVSMLLAYAMCLCIDAAVSSLYARKKDFPYHFFPSLRNPS